MSSLFVLIEVLHWKGGLAKRVSSIRRLPNWQNFERLFKSEWTFIQVKCKCRHWMGRKQRITG